MTARNGGPTRDRLHLAEQTDARPDSLVGTYFHGTAELGWQGCIVAEPHPGVYLVELFDWIVGASSEQHLVRLEDMFAWTFYDTANWMTGRYHDVVGRRWDREREEATP